jgi:hypothetical protein
MSLGARIFLLLVPLLTALDPAEAAERGDFAGMVDIGGRQLYLACKGSGSPPVILEAGAGSNGDVWSIVEPQGAGRALRYGLPGRHTVPLVTERLCSC